MGCIFPTFYESPYCSQKSFQPTWSGALLEIAQKLHLLWLEKNKKKYMPGKKGPKFITTKLLLLNKKHNRKTRITGVQKWVRKKGLQRPLFFQQSCNVMSHWNPSLLGCISSFCILLFATTQESYLYLSKIFDSFLVEAIEWSDAMMIRGPRNQTQFSNI